jgi:hypothetical protein
MFGLRQTRGGAVIMISRGVEAVPVGVLGAALACPLALGIGSCVETLADDLAEGDCAALGCGAALCPSLEQVVMTSAVAMRTERRRRISLRASSSPTLIVARVAQSPSDPCVSCTVERACSYSAATLVVVGARP